jgi:precorrin-4/cobalt-precorrin-4 C11-methyltransferase
MRQRLRILFILCIAVVGAATAFSIVGSRNNRGKFYIVGMGTAPDLITIRGIEVIRSADVILVGGREEQELWKDYTRNKEVWFCPNSLRVLYGIDPRTITDPQKRRRTEDSMEARQALADRIRVAVRGGRTVAFLQSGDPMIFGQTFLLEMLPKDVPTEIVPGIGAFQAASAAVKMSPPYGFDTNAVILTLEDWEGRVDVNEKLMATGSTMVFYTMSLDYPKVFSQLTRFYPADIPVAIVCDAGDRENEKVIRSTVGRFLQEVDYKNLPVERHILLVGKFLKVGQVRKDFVPHIDPGHSN